MKEFFKNAFNDMKVSTIKEHELAKSRLENERIKSKTVFNYARLSPKKQIAIQNMIRDRKLSNLKDENTKILNECDFIKNF